MAKGERWMVTMVVTMVVVAATMVRVAEGQVLESRQQMYTNQELRSRNGAHVLKMQEDCNLVLYRYGNPRWASGSSGRGSGCSLRVQTDCNLVVYNNNGQPVWASNTAGSGDFCRLEVQDDGNVVLYKPIWASNTANGRLLVHPVA